MIVTLTANPSVDRTLELDALHRGAVLRPRATRLDAGGKGVNVTRALHANHVESLAVLPVGGHEGDQLTALLDRDGIPVLTVPIAGAIRANITIAEPDGTTTKLNEPGPLLSADEWHDLETALLRAATDADWIVLSGSLPPGTPPDAYGRLVDQLHGAGARVAVDADGPALQAAIAAGADLVKPNRRELEAAAGRTVTTPADAVAAIAVLRGRGARSVLASLGPLGAVLVDATGHHHASSPAITPRSTVGAGDATLAGFLATGGEGPTALRTAVTWGAAAVSLAGSRMPTPADLRPDTVQLVPLGPQEALR